MTYAARYSRTIEPELTIYRDGVEIDRVNADRALDWLATARLDYPSAATLREQIEARLNPPECREREACHLHAVDGERCVLHGGSDEL